MIQLVVLLFFAKLTQFEIGKSGKNFDVSFIGLFQKKDCTPPPCWGGGGVRSWPPGFPVKFTVTPLEFSFFFTLTLLEIHFSSIFGIPPGIPPTFTLPPGTSHWYPQQGYNFFQEKLSKFERFFGKILSKSYFFQHSEIVISWQKLGTKLLGCMPKHYFRFLAKLLNVSVNTVNFYIICKTGKSTIYCTWNG